MAKIGNFNQNNYGEMDGNLLLPKDDYLVEIVASDYRQNKDKTGHFLYLERDILAGPMKGRKYFSNLNLDHPNPIAVEMANKEFNSTKKACGVPFPEESEELHHIPHIISVYIKKGKNGGKDQNAISDIKPAEGYEKPSAPKPKFEDDEEKPKAEEKPRRRPIFEDD